MASIDNLNFYNTWLPAGQQTDRYSSQPWCLRSKNLDIFSSSKSVKATAWSNPVASDSWVIAKDGDLELRTDGKVYQNGTLLVDPSTNFPVYQVCYTWKSGTYANATRWTPKDLVAKYEWNELESFAVFTDRSSYVWRRYKETAQKSFDMDRSYNIRGWSLNNTYGYQFQQQVSWSTPWSTMRLCINLSNWKLWGTAPIRVYAVENASSHTNINLYYVNYHRYRYYYDQQTNTMQPQYLWSSTTYPSWDIKAEWGILLNVATMPTDWDERWVELTFNLTKVEWADDYAWSGYIYIDMNWWPTSDHRILINWERSDGDYDSYYTYLPLNAERKLQKIWSYGYSPTYWMKGTTMQNLYKWVWSWTLVGWQSHIIYDFVNDMAWECDPSMDVIGMIIWNEQVYMIWNIDGDWYIIPCDLTWWTGTPYIAYWCTFKWATNIDYLMYLVWDDRGISQLRVYNWQELVSIIGWSEEENSKNLTKSEEQYKFNWKMVEYRGDLVLWTSDNRLFQYWQTFWGKGWAFIHELPWTLTDLRASWNDLEADYTVTTSWTTTGYTIKYQDDTPIKKYNTEWIAEYPIVIWNHLLEKEESDLYVSYILPSANTSLEFWGMANHYHFWTFTSADNYTFSTTASYKMKGCTGNYVLKFIEKNGNQYTFRLEGDLPVQTANDMKITDSEWTELITYSDSNHFRKIGEITTTEYQEWEFRFHNLNNKLELPKSHSLQIMVKWKWTANYTPELFALDLVANQRDRW